MFPVNWMKPYDCFEFFLSSFHFILCQSLPYSASHYATHDFSSRLNLTPPQVRPVSYVYISNSKSFFSKKTFLFEKKVFLKRNMFCLEKPFVLHLEIFSYVGKVFWSNNPPIQVTKIFWWTTYPWYSFSRHILRLQACEQHRCFAQAYNDLHDRI